MEVLSLLTNEKRILCLLEEFVLNYPLLRVMSKDNDTYYLKNIDTDRVEILYHFNNDVEFEFSYNFSSQDIFFIKKKFIESPILLVDISFKDATFINKMITEFIAFLKIKDFDLPYKIVLDDPFKGLLIVDKSNNLMPAYVKE